MLTTAATVAVLLMVLGELSRVLLHFTIGSLSIAGGVILLVIAVWMVLAPPTDSGHRDASKHQIHFPSYRSPVPYLLNPVGIVGLMTISAEAKSLSVFAVEFGILVFVLLLDVVVFRWAYLTTTVAERHLLVGVCLLSAHRGRQLDRRSPPSGRGSGRSAPSVLTPRTPGRAAGCCAPGVAR